MRILLTIVLFLFSFQGVIAQPVVNYNKALADSLGADDYGMKRYVLVILRTGQVAVTDKNLRDSLFRGHMKNIQRLADDGKLILAGPFVKEESFRGLFILNVATKEEAKSLVLTDPAVAAGIFDYDLLQWYGSAALPLYLPHHKALEKRDK